MIGSHYFQPGNPEELAATLESWRKKTPGMGLLALFPEAEKEHVAVLQRCCRERSIPLVGAIFPALIGTEGFTSKGFWLIRFDEMPPHFIQDQLDAPPYEGGRLLHDAIQSAQPHSASKHGGSIAFLIFDGMLPHIGSILINLHASLPHQLPCTGVNAGSETFQPMPCLFDADRTIGNAALGILLPGSTRFAVEHGYPVSKTIMRATSTVGNRIDKIDGKPAMTVYQEVIKSEFGIDLTHENFYDYAVHYPFGVVTALDVLVRIPVAFGEDGSIFCVGEVPPSSVLRLLRAPSLDESNCIDRLMVDLHSTQPPTLNKDSLLTFYCAGRRMHFGEQANLELKHLHEASGGKQLVGALTLGEIDSSPDLCIPRFHNATVVCLS